MFISLSEDRICTYIYLSEIAESIIPAIDALSELCFQLKRYTLSIPTNQKKQQSKTQYSTKHFKTAVFIYMLSSDVKRKSTDLTANSGLGLISHTP